MNGELERQRRPRGSLGRLVPFMTSVFPRVTSAVKRRFCAPLATRIAAARQSSGGAVPGHAAAFRGVREAKVTTNCYHCSFFWEVRRGKCLIINWLPPRDSNPDMLIQSLWAEGVEIAVNTITNQSLTPTTARTEARRLWYRKVSVWRIAAHSVRHILRHTSRRIPPWTPRCHLSSRIVKDSWNSIGRQDL